MNEVIYYDINTYKKLFKLKLKQDVFDINDIAPMLVDKLDQVYGDKKFNTYFIIAEISLSYEMIDGDLITSYELKYEFGSKYNIEHDLHEYNIQTVLKYLDYNKRKLITNYTKEQNNYIFEMSDFENIHSDISAYIRDVNYNVSEVTKFLRNKYNVTNIEYENDNVKLYFSKNTSKDDNYYKSLNTVMTNYLKTIEEK